MRRGFSLLELVVVLSVTGTLLAIAVPPLVRWRASLAVHEASGEVISFYHTARYAALLRATRVRLEFGPDTLKAVYEGTSADSTFLIRPGPSRLDVALTATRPVIEIAPNGLGWGAANTTLVFRRGSVADTLTTSRLGRLRRR
jgi:prepilin-type N-terminal cleavage/methylation domain-containing protein